MNTSIFKDFLDNKEVYKKNVALWENIVNELQEIEY
jgi:hypothetical protein